MRNLLKALHYVSTNLAEIRLDLPYAMTKYPDDTWKNVENMLAGANHTIETAIAEIYAIEEMAELKSESSVILDSCPRKCSFLDK